MTCKYYKPRMKLLLEYCKCLYKLPGCSAGGQLHILLDDNNYRDGGLAWCRKNLAEHTDAIEHDLALLILDEYDKLTLQERVLFDNWWTGRIIKCEDPRKCESCELIEIPWWMEE